MRFFRIDVQHHILPPNYVSSLAGIGITQAFGNATFTRDLVRQCNEDSAALVAEFPARFGIFAGLPLPDVELTLREIDHALDTIPSRR